MAAQVETQGQEVFDQPSGITIRRMRLEDVDQVQAIDHISFSMPWPANSFRYELEQNPSSRLWVAEGGRVLPPGSTLPQPDGGGQVVGNIVVWMILDEAHIATLAVLPEYRRQSISSRLLAVGLIDAIDHGALSATLEVRAGNQAAQALYLKFQFEVVGMRKRYYRDNNDDALIMTLSNLGSDYRGWLVGGAFLRSIQ